MPLPPASIPAGGGLAAALRGLGFHAVGSGPRLEESVRVRRNLRRVTWSAPSMGTRVSVTVVHPSADMVDDTLGDLFGELDRVVALLNRHDGRSAVSVLNDQGVLVNPPQEVRDVVLGAVDAHRTSGGAFDVTVTPLVELLRRWKVGHPVLEAELGEARARAGMSGLRIRRRSIRLMREGMGLTLDGIAKGYVVDRMAQVLLRRGLTRWLIDAGGDVRASGRTEEDRPWRIGVQDPHKRRGFPAVTELGTGAIATSGGYENSFSPDGSVHHVVDATTGRSPVQTLSASVVAPTAMLADALATSALVLGGARAVSLVETLPGCACLLLGADGGTRCSSRWRSIPQLSS